MELERTTTDMAPLSEHLLSQAICVGEIVFVSGQLAVDPETNKLDSTQDIVSQTRLTLENLKVVVEASGSSLSRVARVEIFLEDLAHMTSVNEVYLEFFVGDVKPARQAIEASRLARNALIEISCIAVRG